MEIQRSAEETRKAVLEELRSIFGVTLESMKENTVESVEGVAVLGCKGILPSPKDNVIPPMQRKNNSAGSVVEIEGTPTFLLKIKLMPFNGKEP